MTSVELRRAGAADVPPIVAMLARAFDDEPDRARDRPLRRMPRVGRDEEDLAGADRDIVDAPVLGDLQHHVAAQLVEELLDRIVVKIDALIGAADNHHGHIGLGIK